MSDWLDEEHRKIAEKNKPLTWYQWLWLIPVVLWGLWFLGKLSGAIPSGPGDPGNPCPPC